MNTATTISRMLLLTGALSLCLMGGTKIVYAESNSAGKGLTADEARHVYVVELNQLRTDIVKGDQEKVNHDVGILFEILGERPMGVPDVPETKPTVPETSEGSQEFQGYDSGA